MNLQAWIGIGLAGIVLWFGVFSHAVKPEIFFDSHALILVLGGTAAAALLAFRSRQFNEVLNLLLLGILFPTKRSLAKTAEQILILASRPSLADLDDSSRKRMHPFLLEGYMLVQREDLSREELKVILLGRCQRFVEHYSGNVKTLAALAKYPPAFGLLGACTGMIAMMSNLGTAGKDTIGSSMAIALVATFWGIGLANFVFLPLADHAQRLNAEDSRLRFMVASSLLLIREGVQPTVVYDHLLGFLSLAERATTPLQKVAMRSQRLANGADKPDLKLVEVNPGGKAVGQKP